MGLDKVFKESKCVVCTERTPGVVFDKCKHQCVCHECFEDMLEHAKEYPKCPLCRADIVLPERSIPNCVSLTVIIIFGLCLFTIWGR